MKRSALVALLAVALVLALGGSAGAHKTFHGRKLVYGVAGQKFWLAAGADQYFHNAIFDGVARWNATTDTPVSYSNTATQSLSRLDFYRSASSTYSYCATTRHYVDTQVVDADSGDGHGVEPQSNWWWAKVVIDREILKNTFACSSVERRDTAIAHEQGHAMGLAHSPNEWALMYADYLGKPVLKPQLDDRNGINALY